MTGAAVLVLVPDLFFRTKIESTARAIGVRTVPLAPGEDASVAARASGARGLLVDLNLEGGDPLAPVAQLRANSATASVRIVGFLSHLQDDLREKAVRAGFDQVLARSRFSADLPTLLRELAAPPTGV